MSVASENPKLRLWLDEISQGELPVFAHTARCMTSVSTYQSSSAVELAEVILRDAAMTARVLRMANSTFYNPSGRRIDTVSYAIVLLGFDAVRNLALSIALIDTVLSGECHDQAMQELARSVHASVQSKAFSGACLQGDSEDVFIGAVLHRLGAIAFWCFPRGLSQDLLSAYQGGGSKHECERKVLGFTLDDLTLALVSEWRLSDLLSDAFHHPGQPRSQLISAGFGIADDACLGWEHDNMSRHLSRLAKLTGLPVKEVRAQAEENARLACQTLMEFGIDAGDLVILPESVVAAGSAGATSDKDKRLADDADQLVAITREITSMLSNQVDLPTLLSSVAEGIYRALNMDVVILSFVDLKQGKLMARHGIGHKREVLLKRFVFDINPPRGNIFAYCLHSKQAVLWRDGDKKLASLMTPVVSNNLGHYDFMAAPLTIAGTSKALLYVDRHVSQRPFSESDFDAFRHFADLANIGLNLLRQPAQK
jgi:HD-like signal output (HDOD) protein